MTLWLASGSPRRAELLQAAGITLEAHATHADESRRHGVDPVRHAAELAERKARAAPADRVVLAADTVVHIGDTIFEKPADADDAFRMLSALSGATHAVTTGVCVRFGERADTFTVTTSIRFRALARWRICSSWLRKPPTRRARTASSAARAASSPTSAATTPTSWASRWSRR